MKTKALLPAGSKKTGTAFIEKKGAALHNRVI
jgi:hypothetical protein